MSNVEIVMLKFYRDGGMAELRIRHDFDPYSLGCDAIYEFKNDLCEMSDAFHLIDDKALLRCLSAAEKNGFILVENL